MSLKLATRTLSDRRKEWPTVCACACDEKEKRKKRNSLRFGRNLIKPILTFNNNHQPP